MGYFLLLNFNKRTTSVSAKETNGRRAAVGGDANRLQMAVEFNVLGVKQKKEVGRGTDHVSSVEWKPQKNQLKTQSDIFNQK